MANKKKATTTEAHDAVSPHPEAATRKRWIKLTPRDHVLKQIEAQRELVGGLRDQLEKEEKTLEGMERAKEFFPA